MNRFNRNVQLARGIATFGLVPFIGCAVLAWFDGYREWAGMALATYAAIVTTFNGAVHWGRALQGFSDSNQLPTLLYSVIPSLIAWFALMLPLEFSLPMLTAGLMFTWGTEQMVFIDTMPEWYRIMRHGLTTVAVTAMLVGWIAIMLPMF